MADAIKEKEKIQTKEKQRELKWEKDTDKEALEPGPSKPQVKDKKAESQDPSKVLHKVEKLVLIAPADH